MVSLESVLSYFMVSGGEKTQRQTWIRLFLKPCSYGGGEVATTVGTGFEELLVSLIDCLLVIKLKKTMFTSKTNSLVVVRWVPILEF